MRSRIHAVVLPSESGDFLEEIRRVFLEFGRTFGAGALAGECSPPIDVSETDEAVEVVVDLPGVDRSAVRIMMKGDAVLIRTGPKVTPLQGRQYLAQFAAGR